MTYNKDHYALQEKMNLPFRVNDMIILEYKHV